MIAEENSVNPGTRLRKLREEHRFSQTALADALGVTRAAVSGWERGVSRPSMEHLLKLSELYEIGLAALTGENAGQGAHSGGTGEAEHSGTQRRPVLKYILKPVGLLITGIVIGAIICTVLLAVRAQPQETDGEDATPISELEKKKVDFSIEDFTELEGW